MPEYSPIVPDDELTGGEKLDGEEENLMYPEDEIEGEAVIKDKEVAIPENEIRQNELTEAKRQENYKIVGNLIKSVFETARDYLKRLFNPPVVNHTVDTLDTQVFEKQSPVTLQLGPRNRSRGSHLFPGAPSNLENLYQRRASQLSILSGNASNRAEQPSPTYGLNSPVSNQPKIHLKLNLRAATPSKSKNNLHEPESSIAKKGHKKHHHKKHEDKKDKEEYSHTKSKTRSRARKEALENSALSLRSIMTKSNKKITKPNGEANLLDPGADNKIIKLQQNNDGADSYLPAIVLNIKSDEPAERSKEKNLQKDKNQQKVSEGAALRAELFRKDLFEYESKGQIVKGSTVSMGLFLMKKKDSLEEVLQTGLRAPLPLDLDLNMMKRKIEIEKRNKIMEQQLKETLSIRLKMMKKPLAKRGLNFASRNGSSPNETNARSHITGHNHFIQKENSVHTPMRTSHKPRSRVLEGVLHHSACNTPGKWEHISITDNSRLGSRPLIEPAEFSPSHTEAHSPKTPMAEWRMLVSLRNKQLLNKIIHPSTAYDIQQKHLRLTAHQQNSTELACSECPSLGDRQRGHMKETHEHFKNSANESTSIFNQTKKKSSVIIKKKLARKVY